MMNQALELTNKPHIVVATPGRLADHLTSSPGAYSFSRVRYLVLDEADRLLNHSIAPDLATITNHLPQRIQTMLFTATINDLVEKHATLCNATDPPFVFQDSSAVQTVDTLRQSYIFSPHILRIPYLVALFSPPSEYSNVSAIVFASRCSTAEALRGVFVELGIRCTALHSRLRQQERLNSLGRFRAGAVNILIATDVASR